MLEGLPIFERKRGLDNIKGIPSLILAVALEKTIERLGDEKAVNDYFEEMLKQKNMSKEFLDYAEFRRSAISLGIPYEIPYELRKELCE